MGTRNTFSKALSVRVASSVFSHSWNSVEKELTYVSLPPSFSLTDTWPLPLRGGLSMLPLLPAQGPASEREESAMWRPSGPPENMQSMRSVVVVGSAAQVIPAESSSAAAAAKSLVDMG